MLFSRRIQNALDLLALSCSPVLVHRPGLIVDSPVNREKGQHDDRFLIHHVELIADRCNGKAGSCRENGRLGGDAVSWQGIENRRSGIFRFFLGWLGLLTVGRGGRERGECWYGGTERVGGSGAGGACERSVASPMAIIYAVNLGVHTNSASCEARRHDVMWYERRDGVDAVVLSPPSSEAFKTSVRRRPCAREV